MAVFTGPTLVSKNQPMRGRCIRGATRTLSILFYCFPTQSATLGINTLGEVIGASGRIGSLLLGASEGRLAAVPRGHAPGGLSPPGTPIIVATHTSALPEILLATAEDRVHDLVVLCNGMGREEVAKVLGAETASRVTAGCLFFGVLEVGAQPIYGAGAPASAFAGPHAARVAALIESRGPRCRVLEDLDELESVSQLKMIWSSAMWLMCAAHGSCTVSSVHASHGDVLRLLVLELLQECTEPLASDFQAALASLRAYSDSMPDVVPSAAMAHEELSERNGWFLRAAAATSRHQPTHERLLLQVGIPPERIRAIRGITHLQRDPRVSEVHKRNRTQGFNAS
jgi:hypothetical protein